MGKKKNKKNNSLKLILALLIIGICVCLAYGGKYYFEDKKPVQGTVDNKQSNNVVTEEKKQEQKQEENEQNKKQEKNNELEQKPVSEVVNASSEDKAIELAKKTYGITDGVYFRIEQTKSSDVYVVSVRNENTTAAIEWYTVNVSTGEVK